MRSRRDGVAGALAGLLLGLLAGPVAADGASGAQLTAQVIHREDGIVLIRGAQGAWNNPDGCAASDLLALSPTDTEDFKAKYAMALSAHLTGRELSARLSGCLAVGGASRPLVIRLIVD